MNADSIKIECEEDGFWLEIETDAEEPFDRLQVRITDPEALYDHVKAAIGPWLYERDEAQRTRPHYAWPAFAGSGGYETSDPKHPDFHSIHADLYDNREGK